MVNPIKLTTVGRMHRRLLMWGATPVVIPLVMSILLIWVSIEIIAGALGETDRLYFDKGPSVLLALNSDCGVVPRLDVRRVGAGPFQTDIEFTFDGGQNAFCSKATIDVKVVDRKSLPLSTAFEVDSYRAHPTQYEDAGTKSAYRFELPFKPYPELRDAGGVSGPAVHGYLQLPDIFEPVKRIPYLPFDLYPVYMVHLDVAGKPDTELDPQANFLTSQQIDKARNAEKMDVSFFPGFELVTYRHHWSSDTRQSLFEEDRRGTTEAILKVPAIGASLRMEVRHTNWENRKEAVIIAASSVLGLGLAFLAEAIMLLIIDGLRGLRLRARRRLLEEASREAGQKEEENRL